MSLHTEFQLAIMFCTGDIFTPPPQKKGLPLYVTKPFKNDNIIIFYL